MVIYFVLFIAFFLVESANAATIDSLIEADSLPPPQTYFSVYINDSATGMPQSGASLSFRNQEARYTVKRTNAAGWAHLLRNDLPSSSSPSFWVTAGSPGYVSRMIPFSGCGENPTPCTLRFALVKATEKNSLTYTGTLLDSASQQPIAGYTFDLSHSWLSGWVTYVTQTDENGRFAFSGIPIATSIGYLWIRSPPKVDLWINVDMRRSGDSVFVPRLLTTALTSPRRTSFPTAIRDKSKALFRFCSWQGNAVGSIQN